MMSRLTEVENDYWARQATLKSVFSTFTVALPRANLEQVLNVLKQTARAGYVSRCAICHHSPYHYSTKPGTHTADCELAKAIENINEALGL